MHIGFRLNSSRIQRLRRRLSPEDTPSGKDGRADPDPLELDEGAGAAPIDDHPDFAELFGEKGGEEPKEDPGKADEGPGDAKDDLEEKVKELKKPLEPNPFLTGRDQRYFKPSRTSGSN